MEEGVRIDKWLWAIRVFKTTESGHARLPVMEGLGSAISGQTIEGNKVRGDDHHQPGFIEPVS